MEKRVSLDDCGNFSYIVRDVFIISSHKIILENGGMKVTHLSMKKKNFDCLCAALCY